MDKNTIINTLCNASLLNAGMEVLGHLPDRTYIVNLPCIVPNEIYENDYCKVIALYDLERGKWHIYFNLSGVFYRYKYLVENSISSEVNGLLHNTPKIMFDGDTFYMWVDTNRKGAKIVKGVISPTLGAKIYFKQKDCQNDFFGASFTEGYSDKDINKIDPNKTINLSKCSFIHNGEMHEVMYCRGFAIPIPASYADYIEIDSLDRARENMNRNNYYVVLIKESVKW